MNHTARLFQGLRACAAALIAALLLCRSIPTAYAAQLPVAEVQLPETLQVGDAAGAATSALDFTVYFRNLPQNAAVTLRIEAYSVVSAQSVQTRIGEFGAEVRTDARGNASCSGLRALLAMCPPGRVLLLPQWRADSGEISENAAEFRDLSPILLRIASPTVAIECPQTAAVGDTISLTAVLENTSLPDLAAAEFQNDANFWTFGAQKVIRAPHLHMPVYFPELEIISGESCVARRETDASRTRTYRETLICQYEGTVCLRVWFRWVAPCTLCAQQFAPMMGEDPAQTVTIQITNGADSSPNDDFLPENAAKSADSVPQTGGASGFAARPYLAAVPLLAAAVGCGAIRLMQKNKRIRNTQIQRKQTEFPISMKFRIDYNRVGSKN